MQTIKCVVVGDGAVGKVSIKYDGLVVYFVIITIFD